MTSASWLDDYPQTDVHNFNLLIDIIKPVFADIASSDNITPDVINKSWNKDPSTVSAFVGKVDISYQGISFRLDQPDAERLVDLARQVQEWEIEALWLSGKSVTWPNCPIHPATHPLIPALGKVHAEWHCPSTGDLIARIGALH